MRSLHLKYLFFIVLQCLFMKGNAKDSEIPPSLNTVRETGISALVNGVNVITGDFVDSSVDLVIPGPEPLTLTRFYASSAYDSSGYYNGWCHNHQSTVNFRTFDFGEDDKQHLVAKYNPLSGIASYGIARYHNHDKFIRIGFHSNLLVNGLTNCGEGTISGRNHPKNNVVSYDLKRKRVAVQTASGSKLTFLNLPKFKTEFDSFGLQEDIKPNRRRLIYDRNAEELVSKVYLKTIDRDFLLADLTFDLPILKKMRKVREFSVKASDGRKVVYKMVKVKCEDKNKKTIRRYLIEEAIRPNAPKEQYEYKYKDNPLMTKRMRPDGRYMDIEYYMHDKENVENNKVETKFYNRFRKERVKLLFAPVGCDNQRVRTHMFFYHVDKEDKDSVIHSSNFKSGHTDVFDAYNNKTRYFFDRNNRLEKIKKYLGEEVYSKEQFVWGARHTDECINIKARFLSDSGGNVHHARTYTYDGGGNVSRDTFYGNISGHSAPIIFNEYAPIENGCERYGKNYRYTQSDIQHLMTEEIEDNGKGTRFGYYPGTELVAQKYIMEHGHIKMRHFYDYDWMGVLVNTIVDDGYGEDKNDLSGVTERRITSISTRNAPPYGLPQDVREKYLDLSTGQEVLLKRTVNEHSIEGNLISQQVYNADNVLAYTLYWDYDAHGNILCEKNALGDYIVRKYDANDNLIYEENASHKKQILHAYDFSNRLIRSEEIHADGTRLVTSHHYDHLNNRTATIDPYGNRTDFGYDNFSRQKSINYPAIPSENGNLCPTQTTSEHDIVGNVVVASNQCGQRVRTSYNAYGKLTSIQYPDGTQESFEYNLDGTVKKAVAKNGTYTLYSHDCFGRLLEKTTYSAQQELLYKTTSTYNTFHLTSTTDPEGLITSYRYDGAGRVKSIAKGDRLTEYEYNAQGCVSLTKEWYDNNSYRLKKQKYDLLNRVIEEQIVEGTNGEILRESSSSYDADGNLIRQTIHNDAGTATTFTEFNALKMPVKTTDPEGRISYFHYNHNAKNIYGQTVLEVTQTDVLGNQTITTMNALNKPGMIIRKNAIGAILAKKELFYSGIGDVQVVIETVITPNAPERKVVTRWSHDAQHQILDIVEAVGTKEQKHTEFRYNTLGQKESIIKPDGTVIRHEYDKAGRLSRFYASNHSFDYSYVYNQNDNPILILDLLTNTSTIRQYDTYGRMSSEQLGSGKLIQYRYDALDRPTSVIFPDQSGISYTYDAINLRKATRLTKQGEATYEHNYIKYDLSGHVIETQLAGQAGKEINHYDIHGRLTNSQTASWSEEITYDAVGNLIIANINDPGLPAECRYTYDDMYQLKSETGIAPHQYVCDSLYNCVNKDGIQATINSLNQLLCQGNAVYTYNANGNRIVKEQQGQKTLYDYDSQDRLTSIIYAENKWTYLYDAFNRRLSTHAYTKKLDEWVLSSETIYLYQGQNEVGSCDSVGNIQELRILGIGKGAEIGATVAVELNNNVYVPLHDHNGNIVSMVDSATGNVVERYRYSAFGEEKIFDQNGTLLVASSISNPWRFSSKRIDSETGFVYFGRRYYDPSISRWVSPDPLGFEGGPNLYAYVLNSPLSHIDLYGLLAQESYRRPLLNFRGLFSNASKFLGSLPGVSTVGRIIEGIGRHLIPVPYVGTCVSSVGSFFAGDGLKWNPSAQSSIAMVGQKMYNSMARVSYWCGMLNSEIDCLSSAYTISKHYGGQFVSAFYGASKGFLGDCLEFCAQKIGIMTDTVRLATNFLSAEIHAVGQNGVCYQEAHSRGALTLYRAILQIPFELRKCLNVVTYGAAQHIDAKELGLGSAHNYISWRDLIPFIGDPIGSIKALLFNSDNVTFCASGNWPIIDHPISSNTYQAQIKQNGIKFTDTYGAKR